MYLGIDIGGTAVKWGVIDGDCKVIEKSSFATAKESDTALMDQICEVINKIKDKYSITDVGMGSPGFVDDKNGIIAGSDNTPFKNTHAREYIEARTGVKVHLDNDANCATMGEYSQSKKKGNMILLTLGTGVGGGIVINGKLFRGSTGFAGEIGHLIINHGGRRCPCGRRGCLEQYASATALVRLAREVAEKSGCIIDGEPVDIESLDGKKVFDYYYRGSTRAEQIIDEYASYLASGIISLVNIFDPDEIVLAGGITNEGDALMEFLYRHLPQKTPLRIASLTNDAGFIGAALLCADNK